MGPADTYSERDLEAAILQELERFFLEPGTDFSFIARQKSMTIGERRRPLGLPCAAKENREQIELVQLDRSDIRVMEYLVELPPREMLEAKLHEAKRWREGRWREELESNCHKIPDLCLRLYITLLLPSRFVKELHGKDVLLCRGCSWV